MKINHQPETQMYAARNFADTGISLHCFDNVILRFQTCE